MTGLQMQLLMSLHMHSQTNKQTNKTQECSFIRIFFVFVCMVFFFIKKTKTKKNHSGTKQTCISNK